MKLPVMRDEARPSREAMWRQFADLLVDHELAIGEEIESPVGRLIAGGDGMTRRLPGLAVLPGEASAESISEVLDTSRERDTLRPRIIHPLRAARTPDDYNAVASRLLRLEAAPASQQSVPIGVMVLPIRAARVAYELWCVERFIADPAAAVLPRHLDDAKYEAVIALRGRAAIGVAAMQSRGQTGLVCDVFVRPDERSNELPDVLAGRMIELAARSQLSDVYAVAATPEAIELFLRTGFVEVMTFTTLVPTPGTAD